MNKNRDQNEQNLETKNEPDAEIKEAPTSSTRPMETTLQEETVPGRCFS